MERKSEDPYFIRLDQLLGKKEAALALCKYAMQRSPSSVQYTMWSKIKMPGNSLFPETQTVALHDVRDLGWKETDSSGMAELNTREMEFRVRPACLDRETLDRVNAGIAGMERKGIRPFLGDPGAIRSGAESRILYFPLEIGILERPLELELQSPNSSLKNETGPDLVIDFKAHYLLALADGYASGQHEVPQHDDPGKPMRFGAVWGSDAIAEVRSPARSVQKRQEIQDRQESRSGIGE